MQTVLTALATMYAVMQGMYALFVNASEMYLCSDSTFASFFKTKSSPPGMKLRRGYEPPSAADKHPEVDVKQEQLDDYAASTPVDRLILCCHGIGQALTNSNIATDATEMRILLRQLCLVSSPTSAAVQAGQEHFTTVLGY